MTATSAVNMKQYRTLSLKHGGNTLSLLRQPAIPFSQVGSKIGLIGPGLLPASFMAIRKDGSFNRANPTASTGSSICATDVSPSSTPSSETPILLHNLETLKKLRSMTALAKKVDPSAGTYYGRRKSTVRSSSSSTIEN